MPELPEVEARRRAIDTTFKGSRLASCDIYKKGIVKHGDERVQKHIIGETLRSVDRRGKYLIFEFPDALKMTLHFGLFGEMNVAATKEKLPSVCARLAFDNKQALFLLKWASLWFGMGIESLEKLGPDPIAEPEALSVDYLTDVLARKRINMKQFLMDQSIVAGIGAVYADEILFKSTLLPARPAKDVSRQETVILHKMIIKSLEEAIEKIAASGKEDRSFLSLENKKNCPVCGTGIISTRLAGRRTLFCPSCQH